MENISKSRSIFFMIVWSILSLNGSYLWSQSDAHTFSNDPTDTIQIAFKNTVRHNVVGAISVLNAEEIMKYDQNYSLYDALRGRIPGLYGTTNNRGIGGYQFLVDGLPRNPSTVKMSEVAQVLFLKDINSSILYGNHAANGIILVYTKRGNPGKQEIMVNAQYGVSLMKDLPSYLSSADYMELYNEARLNDGLDILYDEEQIKNYRSGDPYRYPNVDYFSKDFIRRYHPDFNVETEFNGGNEVVSYYANAGWQQSTSYLNFGAGKEERFNTFNIRGNIDVNINSYMKSSFNAAAVLNEGYGPTGNNYFATSANFKPNQFTPLLPIDRIDPENPLLISRLNDIDGKYLLGGTQSIRSNPIAIVYASGLINPNAQRTFSFDQKNNIDLRSITEGLTLNTNLSFDFYSTYKQAVRNSFSVYEPTWGENDSIVGLTQYGKDERTGTQSVTDANYVRRFGGYAAFDYDRVFNDIHRVGGSLIGFGTMVKNGLTDIQGTKNLNFGIRAGYAYKDKYLFDFSGAYVFSAKLHQKQKKAFSPSVGMAWVISSEEFMKTIRNINHLKLRFTTGMVHTDKGIDAHFLYNSSTGNSYSYSWYEGEWNNAGTISLRGENLNLAFEKRKDLNIGIEGALFDRQIEFDFNYFNHFYEDQIVRPQTIYPNYYNQFIPYENYDKTAYRGAELGLVYKKKLGEVSLSLGTNILYCTSEVLKTDEMFRNQYQYRTGHPVDARFALVADGFFNDANEIANHAVQSFGSVQPGDIKYVDQNDDNVIDSEDEVVVGRSMSPLTYGLQFNLEWKNIAFFIIGTGENGSDAYRSGNYYWVDGDDKYSEIVRGRWTEETKNSATYPRLSSLTNNNNFRYSSFWLYKNDSFTIDRVQLTYAFPERIVAKLHAQKLRVYLKGSSLFRFSKYRKEQDLNLSGTPYSRTISLGMNITF